MHGETIKLVTTELFEVISNRAKSVSFKPTDMLKFQPYT